MSQNNSIAKRLKDYPDILSVSDIHTILSVNPKTVYKLIDEGKIKSFRIGRLYKVTKRNFLQFLNSNS